MKRLNGLVAGLTGILLALMMIAPAVSAAPYWPDQSTMHGPDISWSGRTWWIADWNDNTPSYVTIDGNGWLHLKQSGSANSAVISYNPCGYGSYIWVRQGIQSIDKYAVVGTFAYRADFALSEVWQEVDIEQAKWGNANGNNFDFWVQPTSQQIYQVFTLPYTNNDTTLVMSWQPTFCEWFILDTVSSVVLKTWNVSVARSATGVFAMMDVWHYLSPTTVDTNVVYKSFVYQANTIYHPPTITYPPEITSSPSLTVAEGAVYSYQPTAINSPTWTCSGRPSGMSVNSTTGALAWANAVAGDYPLVLTAANSAGTDTQSFTLHVNVVVQPPVITSSPPSLNATVGTSYTYQATGTNNPTWTCSGRPSGMTIDGVTGALSWLNPVVGNYTLILAATNSAGNYTQSFQLVVTESAPSPEDEILPDGGDSAAVVAHTSSNFRYTDTAGSGGAQGDTKSLTVSKWWIVGAVLGSLGVIMAYVVVNNGGGKKSRNAPKRRSPGKKRKK